MNPIVLIPARLGSTRLPNKPLVDIAGKPLVLHVIDRAREAAVGEIVVATDAPEIANAVTSYGARAVMTRVDHASGSDRIAEALLLLDPAEEFDIVVNLQGDLPTVEPRTIEAVVQCLVEGLADISTAVAPISDPRELHYPSVVKMIGTEIAPGRHRALYFTRQAPYGEGRDFHHIGLYAYRRAALQRFVSLPPSKLEIRESLEQLRALEVGLRIDAAEVNEVPLGVDTEGDLMRARALLS